MLLPFFECGNCVQHPNGGARGNTIVAIVQAFQGWQEARDKVFTKIGGGDVVGGTSGMELIIGVAYFVDPSEEGCHGLEGSLILDQLIFLGHARNLSLNSVIKTFNVEVMRQSSSARTQDCTVADLKL